MYCPNCMKKVSDTSTKCPECGQPTHTPVAGMATLRVSCRKHLPLWMMIVQPVNFFSGYKVYISVDDQNYVLKSKKKQIDIPVVAGTHKVRIASLSKKTSALISFIGKFFRFAGGVTSSGTTIIMGAAMKDLGNAFSNIGTNVSFDQNELVPVSVKLAWNNMIVEDKKK